MGCLLPIDELIFFKMVKTTNQRGTVPYKATFFGVYHGISPYIALKNRPEICWVPAKPRFPKPWISSEPSKWNTPKKPVHKCPIYWDILGPFPIDELGITWIFLGLEIAFVQLI